MCIFSQMHFYFCIITTVDTWPSHPNVDLPQAVTTKYKYLFREYAHNCIGFPFTESKGPKPVPALDGVVVLVSLLEMELLKE